MQSTQDCLGHDVTVDWNVVSVCFDPLMAKHWIRDARPKAGMWPTAVIVRDPLFENAPQVLLVQRNQEVQTFAADCSYQPLAESVRLGSPEWRFQNPQVHCPQCRIEIGRINAVAIVNEEVLRLFAGNHFSELLKCPHCRGMISHIEVSNLSGSYFHDHKDIEDSKVGGHDDEKIAGQDRLG